MKHILPDSPSTEKRSLKDKDSCAGKNVELTAVTTVLLLYLLCIRAH